MNPKLEQILSNKNKALMEHYYITIPNEKDKPLISFLICYRYIRDFKTLINFFDSFMKIIPPTNRRRFEFLIKLDWDDTYSITQLCLEEIFTKKYKDLIIRPFVWNRWEGKKSFHFNFMHMFSRRNPSSKFITFANDDCIFYRDPIPLLHKVKTEYIILMANPHFKKDLDEITNYKTAGAKLTSPFPIVSTKIIEIIGNIGWALSTDGFFSLLNIILYKKYNINIVRQEACVQIARENSKSIYNYIRSYFGADMAYTCTSIPYNKYYFDLVEQQAKNIYLNMLADGIIKNEK